MSDEKPNGSGTRPRYVFMAKLTPGPANEVMVFADNYTQAIEQLAARFGKWDSHLCGPRLQFFLNCMGEIWSGDRIASGAKTIT